MNSVTQSAGRAARGVVMIVFINQCSLSKVHSVVNVGMEKDSVHSLIDVCPAIMPLGC